MSQKRALLIGNCRFDAPLPPLRTADGDIAALAKVLAEPAIGGFDEVTPILDATSTRIRREIARFLANRLRDDLLLLYFSGHGLLDERGALYLAVKDTEPDLLSATAVPAAFVTGEMDRCRSRRQVLILDCCYSGAFERGAKGAAAIPATVFEGNGIGRVVLTASDSTQIAWEDSSSDNQSDTSVFTRHLVHGLESGEADLDSDGRVTVDELYDYVYMRVVDENPRQTPGKWSYRQQGGDLVLARNRSWLLRPAELPDELRQALDNPLAAVREGAVRELARFLRGSHPALAEAARKAAEQAREDDSRRVVMAAGEVLAAAILAGPQEALLEDDSRQMAQTETERQLQEARAQALQDQETERQRQAARAQALQDQELERRRRAAEAKAREHAIERQRRAEDKAREKELESQRQAEEALRRRRVAAVIVAVTAGTVVVLGVLVGQHFSEQRQRDDAALGMPAGNGAPSRSSPPRVPAEMKPAASPDGPAAAVHEAQTKDLRQPVQRLPVAAALVRDPGTGLVWTQRDNGSDVTWEQANSYCNGLTLGGYRDWALPAIEQLATVYDASLSDDCSAIGPNYAGPRGRYNCHPRLGIHLTTPYSWSSTKDNSCCAWFFSFIDGGRDLADRVVSSADCRALCVRRSGE